MASNSAEIHYKGQRFRSVLVARWAMFLDYLETPWEYEKQSFTLPYAGKYVPPFWLPLQQCWLLVHEDHPSEDELLQAADLSFMTRKWVYSLWGALGEHRIYAFNLPFVEQGYNKRYVFTLSNKSHELMVASPLRGNDAYQFMGYSHITQEIELQKAQDVVSNPRLLEAYNAARSATFT